MNSLPMDVCNQRVITTMWCCFNGASSKLSETWTAQYARYDHRRTVARYLIDGVTIMDDQHHAKKNLNDQRTIIYVRPGGTKVSKIPYCLIAGEYAERSLNAWKPYRSFDKCIGLIRFGQRRGGGSEARKQCTRWLYHIVTSHMSMRRINR